MQPGSTPCQGFRHLQGNSGSLVVFPQPLLVRSPFVLVGVAVLLLLCAGGLAPAAERAEPPGTPSGSGNPGDKKGQPAPATAPPVLKGLDALKLPADAIIVVCEQAGEALRLLPRFVVLSHEQYNAMKEELDRLKGKSKSDRLATPSVCHLEGKIEGQLVYLEVRYDFATRDPNSFVALGCRQAQPTKALLDGKFPLLRSEPDGYVVQVESAGAHQLTVHYTLALGSTGSSRTLDLDLPRAAGTTVKLQISGEVKELRVNDKPLTDTLLTWKNGLLEGSHGPGPADKLTLTWKGTSNTPGGPAVLTAEGRVEMHINDKKDQLWPDISAHLVLKVQGGQAKQWRLLLPPTATIQAARGQENLLEPVEKQEFPNYSLQTVRLKEASADPLSLTILAPARAPLPRNGPGRISVGPFAVLGATRQTGNLMIYSAVPNLQFHFHRQWYTTQREPTAEEQKLGVKVLAFTYELLPLADKPPFDKVPGGASALSLLDLEVETVRGLIETSVSHTLMLSRKEKEEDKRQWQVLTTLDAKLIQPGATQLEVQLPPDCVYLAGEGGLPAPVQDVRYEEDRRVVVFKLPPEGWKSFQSLTLRCRYTRAVDDTGAVSLALPRPLGTLNGGGFQITVKTPEDLELLVGEKPNPLLELGKHSPQEQVWRRPELTAERNAEQLEVRWRPYRPEVRADSVIDLDLKPHRGEILRHELTLQFPGAAPSRLALRLGRPPQPGNRAGAGPWSGGIKGLKILSGGELLREEPDGSVRYVELPSGKPENGSKIALVLSYWFAPEEMPAAGPDEAKKQNGGRAAFQVPLVRAEPATAGDTRVRIWSEPGSLPRQDGSGWNELPLMVVNSQSSLPRLVLDSPKLDQPLSLRFEQPRSAPVTVLVERALIRVNVKDGLGEFYQASFRLSQLSTPDLDLELPATAQGLEVRIKPGKSEDKIVNWGPGPAAEGESRVVRLRLSTDLVKPGSVLEVSYQLPPEGLDGRVVSLLHTPLRPPVLRGQPERVLTRWQVILPSSWVVLGPEGGPGAQRTWGRRGWLLAPRLTQTSADLERWFAGPDAQRSEESEPPVIPALICWRSGLEPVWVVHVPQQGWLLICSLLVLILGLLLYFLSRRAGQGNFSSARLWLAVALLTLVLVTAGVFWPTLVASILYGCQPGVVVLLLACLAWWLWQERNRRRIVFLPSFSRNRSGSSLVRNGKSSSSSRRKLHGEPSTVDEPRSA